MMYDVCCTSMMMMIGGEPDVYFGQSEIWESFQRLRFITGPRNEGTKIILEIISCKV